MTKDYEQVREDLKCYLAKNSMPQYEFAKVSKISASEVSRFLTGTKIGEPRKKHYISIISPIIYDNDLEEEIQEEPVIEEKAEEANIDSLDDTITKLIDKKIEETMMQIAELEAKVKNLEASRDILKELLD